MTDPICAFSCFSTISVADCDVIRWTVASKRSPLLSNGLTGDAEGSGKLWHDDPVPDDSLTRLEVRTVGPEGSSLVLQQTLIDAPGGRSAVGAGPDVVPSVLQAVPWRLGPGRQELTAYRYPDAVMLSAGVGDDNVDSHH